MHSLSYRLCDAAFVAYLVEMAGAFAAFVFRHTVPGVIGYGVCVAAFAATAVLVMAARRADREEKADGDAR